MEATGVLGRPYSLFPLCFNHCNSGPPLSLRVCSVLSVSSVVKTAIKKTFGGLSV